MVANTRLAVPAVMVVFLCSGVHGAPAVRSVRVVTEDTIHIKPCQPVYAALELDLVDVVNRQDVWKVPSSLAENVNLDGRSFPARMSDANSIALFEVDRGTITGSPGQPMSARVLVILYWNAEDGSYVFEEPGAHVVHFNPEGVLTIIVEQPAQREQDAIDELKAMGMDFAMFVLGSGRSDTSRTLPRMEAFREKYYGTPYAGLLSIPIGEMKLLELSEQYAKRNAHDAQAIVRERAGMMRKYFEPHCRGSIRSPSEAKAAYMLAGGLLNQVTDDPEGTTGQVEALRAEATDLLKNVAASPLSTQYRSEAASKLHALGREGDR